MTLQTLEKSIQNQTLVFTNQRALFWQEQKAVIISDLHIGKTAYFRKNGIPIPSDILEKDLTRLSILIENFSAEQLLIVGDFLHAGKNKDFELFEEWRSKNSSLKIILIKGNHDIHKADFLKHLDITIVDNSLKLEPFTFIHEPLDSENDFSISGHLHPGVTVKLERRKTVRLPCFRVSDNQLILPAFSEFTGLDTKSCENLECIAFTEDLIFEL
ncbi:MULTISPECIES: ligase-associated DNA damage response endonuclease PdeM [unclassified Kaistella]|uniref:ligase-associated DNA damage response endonuclease PdeM n=1 Tax=unclassified Kaistella TaxID=2762626 RepID=UPI002735C4EE|nr:MULTISPECIES: ligase-associated DNA damage response endonuclease PdeM [unclassified Kaistella]MDP2453663.1 ligase-associated DNA damage response endonuclease PdeM [Kaistella sp. SH11-4b]MDP2456720.1 ligase-associated DNA damage response endonuclease PdeM [Kaistella sp. SH40-3]MDP2459476.1 ligase-associated DNA damage response endonuclease PdeM [Kaistella sp. SH19-2b]